MGSTFPSFKSESDSFFPPPSDIHKPDVEHFKKPGAGPPKDDDGSGEKMQMVGEQISELEKMTLGIDNSAFIGVDEIDEDQSGSRRGAKSPYEVVRSVEQIHQSYAEEQEREKSFKELQFEEQTKAKVHFQIKSQIFSEELEQSIEENPPERKDIVKTPTQEYHEADILPPRDEVVFKQIHTEIFSDELAEDIGSLLPEDKIISPSKKESEPIPKVSMGVEQAIEQVTWEAPVDSEVIDDLEIVTELPNQDIIVEHDEDSEPSLGAIEEAKMIATGIIDEIKSEVIKHPSLQKTSSEISEEDLVATGDSSPHETDTDSSIPKVRIEDATFSLKETKSDSDAPESSKIQFPLNHRVTLRKKDPGYNNQARREVESWSSSGDTESHYYSLETSDSGRPPRGTPASRPTSSEFEVNVFSGHVSSEYETCITSQEGSGSYATAVTSQENSYATAHSSSYSSRESAYSVESESSGHLGSVEISSETSETLVPSALELEMDTCRDGETPTFDDSNMQVSTEDIDREPYDTNIPEAVIRGGDEIPYLAGLDPSLAFESSTVPPFDFQLQGLQHVGDFQDRKTEGCSSLIGSILAEHSIATGSTSRSMSTAEYVEQQMLSRCEEQLQSEARRQSQSFSCDSEPRTVIEKEIVGSSEDITDQLGSFQDDEINSLSESSVTQSDQTWQTASQDTTIHSSQQGVRAPPESSSEVYYGNGISEVNGIVTSPVHPESSEGPIVPAANVPYSNGPIEVEYVPEYDNDDDENAHTPPAQNQHYMSSESVSHSVHQSYVTSDYPAPLSEEVEESLMIEDTQLQPESERTEEQIHGTVSASYAADIEEALGSETMPERSPEPLAEDTSFLPESEQQTFDSQRKDSEDDVGGSFEIIEKADVIDTSPEDDQHVGMLGQSPKDDAATSRMYESEDFEALPNSSDDYMYGSPSYTYDMQFEKDIDPSQAEGVFSELYTHQEEDEEDDDGGKGADAKPSSLNDDKVSTPDNESCGRRSVSSLQEFEKLEAELTMGRKSSQGSMDSLNGRLTHHSKSSDRDDLSVSSLTEFEKLETEAELEGKAQPLLSEIEEGHESQASEASEETISEHGGRDDDSSASDDYEKRMSEIDEIIRQAQVGVASFEEDAEPQMGHPEPISALDQETDANSALPRHLLSSRTFSAHSAESGESQPRSIASTTTQYDTDSLRDRSVSDIDDVGSGDSSAVHQSLLSNIHHTSCAGTFEGLPSVDDDRDPDSLQEGLAEGDDSLRDMERSVGVDSLQEDDPAQDDSLHEDKDIEEDSLQEDFCPGRHGCPRPAKTSLSTGSFQMTSSKIDELTGGDGMISSTDSLERSSSAATHATYQYETDSLMSSSLNSDEQTMIASNDGQFQLPAQPGEFTVCSDSLGLLFVSHQSHPTEEVEEQFKEFLRKSNASASEGEEETEDKQTIDEAGNVIKTRIVKRHIVSDPQVHTQKFTGPDAEEKSQEFVESFQKIQPFENVDEYESTDEHGNIVRVQQQVIIKPEIHTLKFSGPTAQQKMEEYMQTLKKEQVPSGNGKCSTPEMDIFSASHPDFKKAPPTEGQPHIPTTAPSSSVMAPAPSTIGSHTTGSS